jgi:dipeptidyl aminopeptidase/acylaminoacyl peptidase
MEPERLERLLHDAAAPDEDAARERSWDRVVAAYEQRPVRPRVTRRAPVAIAAAIAALAVAVSPPGNAVADWVRDAVGLKAKAPAGGESTAESLPSGGRLLVTSGGTAWIVGRDGTRRRLGAWSGASWSPKGLFVVVWRGRRLAALDPRGHVRWSFQAPRPVTEARWSPSGFRIAYRSGSDLRVVAGDGNGDRVLDPGTFTPMAWRPGVREHVLAYSSGGHVDVVDTDSRERLARILLPHVAGAIAWSADGRHLYVNLGRSLAIYDPRGRRTGRIRMPGRLTVTTFAPARSGELVAVARRDPDGTRSDVALVGPRSEPRVLFGADGRFTRLRFSPDGAWLLVAWPDADQWMFIRPGATGAARVLASPAVSRRFGTSGFPQVSGDWCCAR